MEMNTSAEMLYRFTSTGRALWALALERARQGSAAEGRPDCQKTMRAVHRLKPREEAIGEKASFDSAGCTLSCYRLKTDRSRNAAEGHPDW